jgi:hypothetical protein
VSLMIAFEITMFPLFEREVFLGLTLDYSTMGTTTILVRLLIPW